MLLFFYLRSKYWSIRICHTNSSTCDTSIIHHSNASNASAITGICLKLIWLWAHQVSKYQVLKIQEVIFVPRISLLFEFSRYLYWSKILLLISAGLVLSTPLPLLAFFFCLGFFFEPRVRHIIFFDFSTNLLYYIMVISDKLPNSFRKYIEIEDSICETIEKISIMGDHQHFFL